MYTGSYAPWEHYPKYLYHYEVTHPLDVLEDFFDADEPKHHVVSLKGWRDIAVSWSCFEDKRHGPESILYVHELNVKLIEALYLLLLEHEEQRERPKPITAQQLEREKTTWLYSPNNLSDEQLLNPYVYVKAFFTDISLPKYRDYLMVWLKDALTIKHNDDNILTSQEIIVVYENMLKLYSAAWIIHQRNTKEPYLRERASTEVVEQPVAKANGTIHAISPNPTPAESLGLEEVKNLIIKLFPSIQMIIHLGTHFKPFVFFLVILVGDEEKIPEGEISNKIEDHCKFLIKVHAIVHKTAGAILGVEKGSRFWTAAISKGNVVYKVSDLNLPTPMEIGKDVLVQRANDHWSRWGSQGKEFLAGAELYSTRKQFGLATFMLHQATENILKGVIQAILGYRIQMHNLPRMLRLTLLMTDELKSQFHLNSSDGIQQFDMLQNAYAHTHYGKSVEPDESGVMQLMTKVDALYNTAKELHLLFVSLQ